MLNQYQKQAEISAGAEPTALIAMSGGVDSSVAARLMLEQGYRCVGCTMRMFENDMIGEDLLATCWARGREPGDPVLYIPL